MNIRIELFYLFIVITIIIVIIIIITITAKWIDTQSAQGFDTILKFRSKINPTGREIPSKYAVENIARSQVTVAGAFGNGEVCNGVYTFYRRSPGT